MKKQLLSPAFSASQKIFLEAHVVNGIEVDICPLSGGIWFDRFEIKKFDETHDPLKEILDLLPKNPKPAEIKESRRSPKHPEAIMQQRPYGPKGANGVLIVDICPVCAGIWLDNKELEKIRELYPTEAIMQKLSQEVVEKAFSNLAKK